MVANTFITTISPDGVVRRFAVKAPNAKSDTPKSSFEVTTSGFSDILVFTDHCRAVRFSETEITTSRLARGQRAIKLMNGENIISIAATDDSNSWVVSVCINGHGKRTPLKEHPRRKLGANPYPVIQHSQRNGNLVGAIIVGLEDEVELLGVGNCHLYTWKVKEMLPMHRET